MSLLTKKDNHSTFCEIVSLSIEIGCNGKRIDTQISGMEWRAQVYIQICPLFKLSTQMEKG